MLRDLGMGYLVFWRICHFSKTRPNKLKQNKANKVRLGHGFGIFLTYNPPISVIPSRIFQRTWYSLKNVWPDFVQSLWWKERSHGLKETLNKGTISQKYGAFCYSKIHLYICHGVFLWSWHSLMWMFITIRNMFLQERASSLFSKSNSIPIWKNNISNLKMDFVFVFF